MTTAEQPVNQEANNAQPSRMQRIKVAFSAIDKKQCAKVGGILVAVGGLLVVGTLTGMQMYAARK